MLRYFSRRSFARALWLGVFALAGCTQWRLGPGEHAAEYGVPETPLAVSAPEGGAPDAPERPAGTYRVSDIYAFIACASASNPGGRWSEPAVVKKGLASVVDDFVIPRYRQGYRRFYVDSPFGKETDDKGKPQFGFFGAVRVADDSPWRRGFIDAWQRATKLSGIKVMAYLGNPYSDAAFKRVALDPARRAEAVRMLRAAVAPLRAAGFQGIGIDASFATDEDSPLGDFLKELDGAGVEVFIEGTPKSTHRWLTRFGTIRTTWFARYIEETRAKAREAGKPEPREFVEVSECRGERIQLFEGTVPWKAFDGKKWEEWGPRWVKSCLDAGEKPAVGLYGFPGDGKRAIGVE